VLHGAVGQDFLLFLGFRSPEILLQPPFQCGSVAVESAGRRRAGSTPPWGKAGRDELIQEATMGFDFDEFEALVDAAAKPRPKSSAQLIR
jgi:hypothetical protein